LIFSISVIGRQRSMVLAEHFHPHPLDIDLNEVDALELVQQQLADIGGVLIVDLLVDEFIAVVLAQLQAAEARPHEVVRRRDLQHPGLGLYRAVHRDGVEAVVERDVARERIVDALLHFDHKHDRHQLRPSWRRSRCKHALAILLARSASIMSASCTSRGSNEEVSRIWQPTP